MKTITVSVADDLYAVATAEATKRRKTLSDLLHDLLAGLQPHRESADDAEQRAELEQLFAIVDAKPKLPGSVGPLNREQLYQRGIPAKPDSSTDVPHESQAKNGVDQSVANNEVGSDAEKQRRERFLRYLDELNAKPRQLGPSVGPLNREELYQRGISGH